VSDGGGRTTGGPAGQGKANARHTPTRAGKHLLTPSLPLPTSSPPGLSSTSTSGKFRLPLTTSFLAWDTVRGFPISVVEQRQLVPFAALTSGFAFMSAAAHFIVLACYATYIADLRKGLNRFRWYEYSVSSSLMIVEISMLFGCYDIMTLCGIASVNACMNLFGYMHELHNQTTKKVDWTAFIFGSFAGAVPWAIIFAYAAGPGTSTNIPTFVWVILAVYLVAFNTFPFNMVFQYKAWPLWWTDEYHGFKLGGYYFGERAYQIQSLVSKSLLLWLVLGGVNQPNSYTKS
jgi:hypothetical protein